MKPDPFDKFLQDSFEDFESQVDTDKVWTKIESQVPKKSGRPLVYFFLSLGILLGSYIWLRVKKEGPIIPVLSQQIEQKKTDTADLTQPELTLPIPAPRALSLSEENMEIEPMEGEIPPEKKASIIHMYSYPVKEQSSFLANPTEINKTHPAIKHLHRKYEDLAIPQLEKVPIISPNIKYSDEVKLEPEKREKRWEMHTYLLGALPLPSLKMGNTSGPSLNYTSSFQGLELLGIGHSAGYRIPSGWKIGAGLSIQHMTGRFTFASHKETLQIEQDQIIGFRLQGPTDTLFIRDELAFTRVKRRKVEHYNKYLFIDLPFYISYQIPQGQTLWELESGGMYNFLFQSRGRGVTTEKREEIGPSDNKIRKGPIGLTGYASLGLGFPSHTHRIWVKAYYRNFSNYPSLNSLGSAKQLHGVGLQLQWEW